MAGDTYHEPYDLLPVETRDLHRALWSVIEELEAVDWYQQRVVATSDAELRAVLEHNRDEEIEHACMVLEHLRRRSPRFDEMMRRYLFTTGPIRDVPAAAPAPAPTGEASLGVGGLRTEA